MLAVGEHVFGSIDPILFKLSTGFAGGVGGSGQEMCGVLSAGVMLIGAVHGRAQPQDDNQLAKDLINRYRERFVAEFGTTICEPLNEKVHSVGGLGECASVGERGASMVLELLEEGVDVRKSRA